MSIDVGSAGGGALISIAPFTGPAAPFVALGGTILSSLQSVFGFGSDPRKVPDTQKLEAMQIEINKIWNTLVGDSCAFACQPGECGRAGQLIFNCPTLSPSAWRVPPSIQAIDEAEGNVIALFQWARSNMQRSQSLENPAVTDAALQRWQSHFSALRDMVRRQLPVVRETRAAAAGVESVLGLSEGSGKQLLGLGILGVGIVAAAVILKVL